MATLLEKDAFDAAVTGIAEQETAIEGMGDDENDQLPARYEITSYGADFTIDSIVARVKRGDIYVPPFQRRYVWSKKDASLFVESLLLGLPVPGIFLAQERETRKLIVVDGQQRVYSLNYFYSGKWADGTVASLTFDTSMTSPFTGKTYDTLNPNDRRRLDDSILHATIFRQDTPDDEDSSVYNVFYRLNSGGKALKAQEIRSAIFHGKLDTLLNALNGNSDWREIFGGEDKNLRDQELILRFFALFFSGSGYKEPMAKFLNDYMRKNRDLTVQSEYELSKAFIETISVLCKCIGKRAFRLGSSRALNAAIFDSVMVGVATRLQKGTTIDCSALETAYNGLINDQSFLQTVRAATTNSGTVATRLRLTTELFNNVP